MSTFFKIFTILFFFFFILDVEKTSMKSDNLKVHFSEAYVISELVVNNLEVSDLQLKSVQQTSEVQNSQTYMR